MSDIFKLFDGTLNAGGTAAVAGQNGSSFSDVVPENDLISRLASGSDSVDLLVDYSDFSNFVTFNSAESYVNVTADQILNDYPYGGSVDDLQEFLDSLDGYQRYFLESWPSRTGHIRFNPAVSSSYIKIDDIGVRDGVTRSSLLSPGTGSFSIQAWIDVPQVTGSEDAHVIFQKSRLPSGDGYTVFISGSSIFVRVVSGSVTTTVDAPMTEMPMFFSAVCDRSTTGTLAIYTATTGTFPALINSTSLGFTSRFDLASGSFYIGSGSIPLKVIRPLTGSIDDVSAWSLARTPTQMSSSFNRKVYAQPGLIAAWRFNEATESTPAAIASIVRDCSGHRLDGRIQSYFSGSRGSGSIAYDSPDPILSLDDRSVISYVLDAQSSGTLYDRNNQSIIFNLFPEAFSTQDPTSSDVFRNFALIMARHFDRIRLYISQLANLRRVSYDEFDQAPDELLEEVGEFFGWDLKGSFISTDALRYFVGRDVAAGPQGNAGLSTKLSDIKAQFWRRALQNMMYLYKTKGTRESVESLLRIYGVNNGFVRLKEYARKTHTRLETAHVIAEKSINALAFGSGTIGSRVTSSFSPGPDFSVEMMVCFPLAEDESFTPTRLSGSIFSLSTVSPISASLDVRYEKAGVTSITGSVYATSSAGVVEISGLPIFDGGFYNISLIRETATGSLTLRVMKSEDDALITSESGSAISGSAGYSSFDYEKFAAGAIENSGNLECGEFWAQEVRLWNDPLTIDELTAHAINFESYGRDVSYDNKNLTTHLRLNDGGSAESNGKVLLANSVPGSYAVYGTSFASAVSPFKKFLEQYAYIPGIDYGWNQEKVRTYEGSSIATQDRYTDERFVSLEFNMYDALNEDISHLMTSYEELGNFIGRPMNRYRESYEGLQQMRETYFKRLQGKLNFRVFADMLDFFDTSFVSIARKLMPARTLFNGDEMVIESHMLERPKYQYQIRPVIDGLIDISGSIPMTNSWGDVTR